MGGWLRARLGRVRTHQMPNSRAVRRPSMINSPNRNPTEPNSDARHLCRDDRGSPPGRWGGPLAPYALLVSLTGRPLSRYGGRSSISMRRKKPSGRRRCRTGGRPQWWGRRASRPDRRQHCAVAASSWSGPASSGRRSPSLVEPSGGSPSFRGLITSQALCQRFGSSRRRTNSSTNRDHPVDSHQCLLRVAPRQASKARIASRPASWPLPPTGRSMRRHVPGTRRALPERAQARRAAARPAADGQGSPEPERRAWTCRPVRVPGPGHYGSGEW